MVKKKAQPVAVAVQFADGHEYYIGWYLTKSENEAVRFAKGDLHQMLSELPVDDAIRQIGWEVKTMPHHGEEMSSMPFFAHYVIAASRRPDALLPADQGVHKNEFEASQKKTTRTKLSSERKSISKALRFSIFQRDNFACRICGASPLRGDAVRLHIDHITPISKGGKDEQSNFQTLCEDCNRGKGTRIVQELNLPKL